MAWVYKVRSRRFYHNGKYMFSAKYAGQPGYMNDPDQECVVNKGPLPRGVYTISDPFFHVHTKKWTLRLTPAPSNHMCGRSGFLIHGANAQKPYTSSNGCIILPLNDRMKISDSKDPVLIVEPQ